MVTAFLHGSAKCYFPPRPFAMAILPAYGGYWGAQMSLGMAEFGALAARLLFAAQFWTAMAEFGWMADRPLLDAIGPMAAVPKVPSGTTANVPVADDRSSRQGARMSAPYPFVPKSNARLSEGDFWALPLVDGSQACGRVLQLPPENFPGPGLKVQFLGALMDWHGPTEPDPAALAGVKALDQGVMHVISITRIGGSVLGNRDLALDGIEPGLFINGTEIQRGYTFVRDSRRADIGSLAEWSWWGWNVMWLLANRHFLGIDLPGDAEPTR